MVGDLRTERNQHQVNNHRRPCPLRPAEPADPPSHLNVLLRLTLGNLKRRIPAVWRQHLSLVVVISTNMALQQPLSMLHYMQLFLRLSYVLCYRLEHLHSSPCLYRQYTCSPDTRSHLRNIMLPSTLSFVSAHHLLDVSTIRVSALLSETCGCLSLQSIVSCAYQY